MQISRIAISGIIQGLKDDPEIQSVNSTHTTTFLAGCCFIRFKFNDQGMYGIFRQDRIFS